MALPISSGKENLLALAGTTSDHSPLLLQLTGKSCCKKSSAKPFRFKNLWFQYAGFEEQVSSWWASETATEDAAGNMVKKLSFLRSKLRCWNRPVVGNVIVKKEEPRMRLDLVDDEEESRQLTIEESEERKKLKFELDNVLQQQEEMWKQRSRI